MLLINRFEKYLKNCRGAIHVGAHEGEERTWYKKQKFSSVLWFEPNADLFPRLKQNIKDFPGQIAFNIGIHDSLKKGQLHIASNDGQSSSLLELGTHSTYYPDVIYTGDQEVRLIRLDEFFRTTEGLNIDNYNFLNIDVQGTELNVIKSLGAWIEKMDYVYVEVNEEELYVGCALLKDIDEYLRPYGFFRMSMIMKKAHWGDAFYKRY